MKKDTFIVPTSASPNYCILSQLTVDYFVAFPSFNASVLYWHLVLTFWDIPYRFLESYFIKTIVTFNFILFLLQAYLNQRQHQNREPLDHCKKPKQGHQLSRTVSRLYLIHAIHSYTHTHTNNNKHILTLVNKQTRAYCTVSPLMEELRKMKMRMEMALDRWLLSWLRNSRLFLISCTSSHATPTQNKQQQQQQQQSPLLL